MKHKGTKRLETERLILRRYVVDDAADMYMNWASEDEVTKFLTWPTHENVEVTKMILTDWVEKYNNDDFYNWAIEIKETGELVGNIAVVNASEKISEASFGWCMGTKWWGKGIMPEAASACMEYLFNEVGYNRIFACHNKKNPKSGRVMEKIGMIYEGTMRSGGIDNQGIMDKVCYGILKSDYVKNKTM